MHWQHIILEAFCGFEWDDNPEFWYDLNGKKIPNPKYDPQKPKRTKPDYCPGEPCYTCYENDCPYLCTTSVDKEDYDIMVEAWIKNSDHHV